jgi:hypothetical protein
MKINLTCIILMLSAALAAQSPVTFSYQAVVRNGNNLLLMNQNIGVRISILVESAYGEMIYGEIYPSARTNANGLLFLEIGNGEPLMDKFSVIDWAKGPYFIKTEIDPEGGSHYTITGTSEILSVPYALHAATAATLTGSFPYSNLSGKPDLSLYATRNMHNQSIINLAIPINARDAATKDYVDSRQDSRWTGESGTTGNISRPGNVGIGVVAPNALLHVRGTGSGSGSVLFEGNHEETAGNTPASGAGTRMMWYPDKAALRAGSVDGTYWDKDQIGLISTAFGYNALAKGTASTAMGASTTASGGASTAMGNGTTASGSGSTAMGSATTASGNSSTSMGYFTTSSGQYSTAMGRYAKAVGDYSFAIHLSSATTTVVDVPANTFRITGAAAIGGNVAWTNFSDRRLKKDIAFIGKENNLSKILRLNAVRYRWIEHDELLNLGFIAQDVIDIVPESVRYDEHNDIYSMEYTALIPVLVEGMKEQQEIIEKQQILIESQQSSLDNQQSIMERQQSMLDHQQNNIADLKETVNRLQLENSSFRASAEELEKLKADVERIKEMFLVKE